MNRAEQANKDRGVIFARYQQMQTTMAGRVWCGKVAYVSKKGAKEALRRHSGTATRVYRCDLCHHWHLTTQRSRQDANA